MSKFDEQKFREVVRTLLKESARHLEEMQELTDKLKIPIANEDIPIAMAILSEEVDAADMRQELKQTFKIMITMVLKPLPSKERYVI